MALLRSRAGGAGSRLRARGGHTQPPLIPAKTHKAPSGQTHGKSNPQEDPACLRLPAVTPPRACPTTVAFEVMAADDLLQLTLAPP